MLTLSLVKIVLLYFDQPISEGPTPKDQLTISKTKLSVLSLKYTATVYESVSPIILNSEAI